METSSDNEKSTLNTSPYRKPKKSMASRYFVFWLIVLMAFIGAYQLGFEKGKNVTYTQTPDPVPFEDSLVFNKEAEALDFGLFWRVWDLLKEKYVDAEDLDARELMYGAIQGMLAATKDPYTNFLDPENNKQFNQDISGSFEGIGAEIGRKDGVLTIIAPLDNSPAQRSGLRAGDKILRIDDQELTDITLEEAVSLIRGPKGTDVTLTILRNGEQETREIVVTRDTIEVKSVEYEVDGTIATIEVSRFGEDTEREFSRAVSDIERQNVQGIVLDVRNNPGGFLDVAVTLAGYFLPKGVPVVIEEDHDGNQEVLDSKGSGVFNDIPAVVLINEGSASASEIIAGALRDNREDVKIVGMQSFGKGSVQELIPLPQSAAVKITVAKWLTPNGTQINEEGISPDVEVDLSDEDFDNDRDPQLDRAKEILRSEE